MQPGLALNYMIRVNTNNDQLADVSLFAFDFEPQGWMFADGRQLTSASHPDLFARIGTTYGTNGAGTFLLPNLSGRVAIHAGQGFGMTSRTLGQQIGRATTTLTAAQIPCYTHTLPPPMNATGSAGVDQAHSNMQPSLVLNHAIMTSNAQLPSFDDPTEMPFLGQVQITADDVFVAGRTAMDGQLLTIASNTALYSRIGTSFGGNGFSNFGLPDLRGRTAISNGQNAAAGSTERFVGETAGDETVTLSTAEIPSHSHTLPTTGSAGGGQPHENMQPSLTMSYAIAYEGTLPNAGSDTGTTLPMVGQLVLHANGFTPGGWLPADGSLYAIIQYSELYDLIGNTYGGNVGDGSFAVPNLRGAAALYKGSSFSLGQAMGSETAALTINQLAAHTHEFVAIPEPSGLVLACFATLAFGALARRLRTDY